MADKACKLCRRIVKGNICPVCKTTELSKNWKGVLIVIETDSEIAKKAGITAPGRYAVTVK
ncbi:MAG: DNA-directed RNA polymerase subunit E'' [Candidatus Aenigmarchaeota archaeon]|nr:DNA-directed RNA polymerase subunit E'' [Candidatus Aenigmarchaeota archaeon]